MARFQKVIFGILATALVWSLGSGVAYAAGPQQVPTTLVSEGFESGTTPSYETTTLGQSSSARWAPVNRPFTGLKGLWCAGSAGLLSNYPIGTFGLVQFELPQLEEYYSSSATFRYLMPSLGQGELLSGFQVYWERPGGLGIDPLVFPPLATSWKSYTVNLSSGTQALARNAGHVVFKFDDKFDSPGSAAVGQGPTLDDVVISGWMYGPVRNITAVVDDAQVELGWSRPYRSATENTVEERTTVRYRVWRAPYGSTTWTEMTTDSIDATGFVSPSPTEGSYYTYAVQTVGSSGGYGEPVSTTVTFPSNQPLVPVLTQKISPTTVDYGKYTTVTGGLTLSGEPFANADVTLQYYSSGWKTYSTKKTDSDGKVVFSAKPVSKKKTYFRLRFSGTGYETTTAAYVAVFPRPYVGRPTRPSSAYRNRTFTVRASLNPRHTAGSYPVKILCYRYESGKWVYRKGFWAKAYNYSSYSRVYARVKLPYKGYWKMRAYAPADSRHAREFGNYTSYFKVK